MIWIGFVAVCVVMSWIGHKTVTLMQWRKAMDEEMGRVSRRKDANE